MKAAAAKKGSPWLCKKSGREKKKKKSQNHLKTDRDCSDKKIENLEFPSKRLNQFFNGPAGSFENPRGKIKLMKYNPPVGELESDTVSLPLSSVNTRA